ncbi:hypothetical protein EDD11_006847 [Mortierella claussenii]|nr:hypothetical protein EDD11_006847 [Mortierella claussenii]
MTVPESSQLVTTVAVTPTATSTKVHSFIRQRPVTSTSFQASQEESGRGAHNGRVSIQPTGFEGGLLVGLYDPHLGPQCAEYLQQHLVPILDESLSTQLDHSDDDRTSNPNTCKIDPTQVIDTLKSTFKELDELLLVTAITVALTQPENTDMLNSQEEVLKTQEVIAQVVTGSTASIGFLAPHTVTSGSVSASERNSGGGGGGGDIRRHDLYLAQLGDSIVILAGYDAQGQWTARRLNPPETHEHSVRYPGSEEYRKVTSEAKERALTAEQFLTQHNGSPSNNGDSSSRNHSNITNNNSHSADDSFLTQHGKFLGLPVTRAFGDLDWKLEQEARFSVATWVEKSLRAKIDQALGGGRQLANGATSAVGDPSHQDEVGINNLNDPPYISADPKVSRFVLETRKDGQGKVADGGGSDQLLILLNRALLYTTHALTNAAVEGLPEGASLSSSSLSLSSSGAGKLNTNPNDQALISDFELSRVVASALEKSEDNAALAVAKMLDQTRKELGVADKEGEEGHECSVIVVVL